jgi:hypothetical protein
VGQGGNFGIAETFAAACRLGGIFREKPVPAVSLHALTFRTFIRKPCSGLQAMVGHPDVTFPATTN